MKKTLCPIPWMSLATAPNGDYRGCCYQFSGDEEGILKAPNGEPLRVDQDSIDAARQSPLMSSLRAQMLKGEEPEECRFCYDQEAKGVSSPRQRYLKDERFQNGLAEIAAGVSGIGEHSLVDFDLRLGNQCNLKCRTCGPSYSSTWYEDAVALGQDTFRAHRGQKYKLTQSASGKAQLHSKDYNWPLDEGTFERLLPELESVQRLYLTGGEPFMAKGHWRLVDLLIRSGVANNIGLEYNTNLTLLEDSFFKKWAEFKSVYLSVSIDGVEEGYEYLRHPAKWQTFLGHMEKLHSSSVAFGFNLTVSALNIESIPRALLLLHELYPHAQMSLNWVDSPKYYSMSALSTELRTALKKASQSMNWPQALHGHAQEYESALAANYDSKLALQLRSYCKKLDGLRSEATADVAPQVAEFLSSLAD